MLHQFLGRLKINDNPFWKPLYRYPNPVKSTYHDDHTAAAFVETIAEIIAQTLSFPRIRSYCRLLKNQKKLQRPHLKS